MDWQAVLEAQSFHEDDDLDISETLLALSAADKADREWAAYEAHFDEMMLGVDRTASAAALAQRISADLAYRGDTTSYDDMRNADIVEVIDRRKGLPVALGLLYLHLARGLGWDLTGLNFPGHFLLQLTLEDRTEIIDPFHGGRVLSAQDMNGLLKQMLGPEATLQPQHMNPVSVRHVIVRLQNNIKIRALQSGDVARALEILRRMSLFAPGESSIWLEWAGLESRLGNIRNAVALLEQGADYAPDEVSLIAMADARQKLRIRLN